MLLEQRFLQLTMRQRKAGKRLFHYSQMLLYAKYLLYRNEIFSFENKINALNSITRDALNDFILNETAKQPRFIGFGTVHAAMEHISEEGEYIINAGLHGIKMHPDFQKFDIDDERLFPLYETVQGRIPVMYHMGDKRYDYSQPSKLRHVLELPFISISAKRRITS